MSHLTGDIVGFYNGQPVATSVKYFPVIDPYAISFIFYTPEPIQWTFARDLLIEGLEVPSGNGDVKFRPEDNMVVMSLRNDGNAAEFVFQRADIQAIADMTKAMLPLGRESETINWDNELAILLGGS